MNLTTQEINNLYPKLLVKEYESKIRIGFTEAQKLQFRLYAIFDGRINFNTFKITFPQSNIVNKIPDSFEEDYLIIIDQTISYTNIDGLLNSIGWLTYLNCSTIYGSIRNRHHDIVCYGDFDTEFQGQRINWGVGNYPLRVKSWDNHLVLKRKGGDGTSYFNPSWIGYL
jgi:hypothetical protein